MLRLIKSSLSSTGRGDVAGLDVSPLKAVERKLKRDADVGVEAADSGIPVASITDAWLGFRSLLGVKSGEAFENEPSLLEHDDCVLTPRLSPVSLILLSLSVGDFVGSVAATDRRGIGQGKSGRSICDTESRSGDCWRIGEPDPLEKCSRFESEDAECPCEPASVVDDFWSYTSSGEAPSAVLVVTQSKAWSLWAGTISGVMASMVAALPTSGKATESRSQGLSRCERKIATSRP